MLLKDFDSQYFYNSAYCTANEYFLHYQETLKCKMSTRLVIPVMQNTPSYKTYHDMAPSKKYRTTTWSKLINQTLITCIMRISQLRIIVNSIEFKNTIWAQPTAVRFQHFTTGCSKIEVKEERHCIIIHAKHFVISIFQ